MILRINVKPNAYEGKIEKIAENEYNVWVDEKPVDGKANNALLKILSKQFGVSYKQIKIKNPRSRKKIVEIDI